MVSGQIPKTTYNFPDEFAEYVLHQIGIIVGHQGFDNNILLAEALMKLLPQVEIGFQEGKFDNMYTQLKPKIGLNRKYLSRLRQIWIQGTFVAITRNDDETIVTNREIIYPIPGVLVLHEGQKDELRITNAWSMIDKHNCGGVRYVQLTPEDLNDLFPTGVCFCDSCSFQEEVEIEVKPSLKEMELVRPKHSSPIWREIQGEVPMRYAYEDIDLISMSSPDGGFYNEFADGRIPMYSDIQQILESEDTTSFPSKIYYESSMHLIFDEFLFYFNKLLVKDIHRLCNHRKESFVFTAKPNSLREKIRETNEQE